jgi:hypothetical protein
MHWRWKNFPAAWYGMYACHPRDPKIMVEVVASGHFWIWHYLLGLLVEMLLLETTLLMGITIL